jgi:hypothetical protein
MIPGHGRIGRVYHMHAQVIRQNGLDKAGGMQFTYRFL